ncbi:MAG: DUF4834 family protein [Tannerella sp.]|jgi:hypothetical protein|nr:DUF4834 family protein [Tannerella sp.]
MKYILFIVFILFLVPYLLGIIGRVLLGSRPQQKSASQQSGKTNQSSTSGSKQTFWKKKKIISKDEGEYVDYVEIKDKK